MNTERPRAAPPWVPSREAPRTTSPPRLRAWLWLLTAITAALLFNPWTAAAWWLRRRFISPIAAGLFWSVDGGLVIAGGALMRRRRRRPVACRRLLRRVSTDGSLVIGGLLGALVVLEGLLRLFPAVALSSSLRHELGWQSSHRVYPGQQLVTGLHVYSSTLGWEPASNVRAPEVNSNSHGFRGPEEYSLHPVPGTRRVVCIGDSFTFGDGLLDTETMPAQLAVDLNRAGRGRWEVLNLGVDGYGTDQQWLRLQTVGLAYHPDVVVLGFFEEDLARNLLSFRDYAKPYFALTDGELVLHNVPVPTPAEILATPIPWPSWYVAQLMTWLPEAVTLELSPLGALAETRAGRVTLAILDAMRRGVRDHGATLALLIIPRPITARGSDTEHLLARWASETATPVLNLREEYLKLSAAQREQLYWGRTSLYHGHWSPYGARVTAEALAAKLEHPSP